MKVRFSIRAYELLEDVRKSITERAGSNIADEYIDGLFKKINGLKIHPEKYPPCRNPKFYELGFRCFTHKKAYTVVYRVTNIVRIIGFIYGGRHPDNQVKDLFGED